MHTIVPRRLKRGDVIGIVSPSDPITPSIRSQLDQGMEFLKREGFGVELAPHVLSSSLGYSATAREKADDINAFFAAPQVNAIICSQGGFNSNGALPYIDYSLIKANPKVFLGISDITALLNGIYTKTGMITFHGNDVMWGFGRDYTDYDRTEFLDRLVEGKTGLIQKHKKWICIRPGLAEGELIGGNLQTLIKLVGTEYFPDLEGAILFLEEYGEESTVTSVSGSFHQLKQIGCFEKISGMWLGYYKCRADIPIEKIAEEVTGEYGFPILQCDDFGHNTPNTTIPVGSVARLNATDCTVELTAPCVA
jgi:muramoyltetrapeptide carboxypeptidase